jgi:GSCFA family
MSPISFAAARNNQRRNPASTWFAEGKRSGSTELYAFDRLGSDFFNVHCVPRFGLPADGAYFMIGSCFARGLESVLVGNRFNVRSVSKEFDRFDHSGVGTPLGATNRYNTGSILNEIRWALDPASPFPEQAIVDIDSELSVDPHMNPTLKLADRSTTLQRRAIFTGVVRELANSDVVIITLGLVEAWYDTHVGVFTNVTPDPRIVRSNPDRFVFKRLNYVENLQNLEAARALLAQFGKPGHKIIVTVSPVPLMTTFTDEDIVVANTYSKNTLRAVATDFVERYDNVDYFPSYEIVMNSDPAVAWIPDRRHVRGEFANQIMKVFISKWIVEGQTREIAPADLSAVY